MSGTKTCSKCGVAKPLDEFYIRKATPDGRQYYCKACCSDRQSWYRRLSAYGITKEQFESMLLAQKGNCAICFGSFGDESPNLDHRHGCCAPKKACERCARQLLCSRCNLGIGKFADDCSLLASAMEYLVRHGGCK